uniref:Olfactory receptor family 6 subfamily C member 74 n=1 Tax=Nannospalax galili TaxID=1026970 RepID=A0A8C6W3R2_NANGA
IMKNHTTVTVFILLGLTDDLQLQVLTFLLLFFTYMLSVTGNLTIITLTLLDSHLKTPMYFFLRNFSFLEIFFTTVCIPKFLLSAILTLLVTLVLVSLSYTNITRTILRIPSSQQRKKAFPTCSSHIVVVSISYGSCIFMYMKPSAKERVSLNKGIALLSTSVAPMLNPFIYTLRNKQVKAAFKNMTKRTFSQ